jgi:hypothetical protein
MTDEQIIEIMAREGKSAFQYAREYILEREIRKETIRILEEYDCACEICEKLTKNNA